MAIKKFNAVAGFSVGEEDYIIDVVDSNANVSANTLTVTAKTHLGLLSNVTITGGSAGYVLKTDGDGNLSWANQSAGGANTYVQFNDNGLFNGTSAFAYNKDTSVLTLEGNLIASTADLGNLATANYLTGTLTTNAQPNIISVGTLTSLAVATTITAGTGDGGSITGANLVSANYFTGTLTTNAQPNITSTGRLTSLEVIGNVDSGNANLGNLVTANYFNGTLTAASSSQPNIHSVGTLTSLAVTGNVSAGNVTGGNLVSASYVQGTLITAAQPNITSLGTLNGLQVIGDTDITGNLKVNGNITYLNSNVTYLVDPITEQGGSPNGATLTSNDLKDRGQLLHYYSDSTPVDAFSGWKNASGEFVFGKNVSVTENIVTVNEYGNIRANTFFGTLVGDASLTTLAVSGNIIAGNVDGGNLVKSTYLQGTLTTTAQPNITSVGLLSGLTVGNLTSNTVFGNGTIVATGNANVDNIGAVQGIFTGNVSALNANLGNLVTSNYFTGNGSLLSSITGANVTGAVAFATTANSVAGANVSGQVNYAAVANSVAGGNVSGQVANALVAGTVYTAAQPAITSVGKLTNLDIGGNLIVDGNLTVKGTTTTINSTVVSIEDLAIEVANSATTPASADGGGIIIKGAEASMLYAAASNSITFSHKISADGSLLTNVNGSQVTGQVANALVAGTVYTAAQPAITSVGTLTSLAVTGNITSGNATLGNLTTSNFYVGNGSLLSSITGANVTGEVNFAAVANSVAGANVTGAVAFATTANSVAGGNVSGQVANALVAGTVYTAAQPAITSVGTLTGLVVNGNSTFNGNLTVTGTTTVVNSTVTKIVDPIIELGGTSTGSPLTTNDGQDRGELLHYHSGSAPVDAFMGWKNSSNEFVFASNVTVVDNTVTVQEYGNLHADTFIGNLVGSATLANLTVTGNITSGNANLGNLTTSNFYAGNGSLLSSITGANVTGAVAFATTANSVAGANVSGQVNFAAVANSVAGLNVSGQVANSLIAGTVYTAAQPAITSVGTLTSLDVTGDIISGNANLGNLVTANFYVGDGGLLTNIAATSGTSTTVSASAQPNITSVGSLTGLVVSNSTGVVDFTSTANVALGDVSNLHVTGGTTGQYLKTDGTGNLSWDTTKMYGASNITNVVAGSAIGVETIYTDPAYPSGKFMIYQLGPISMNVTDTWATGSATKNAYANSLAGSVNTQDITISLSLANATFNVLSSDRITLGGDTIITGTALTSLGISGTGGTYTIPSSAFSSSTIQTRATSTVQVSLTTNRSTQVGSGTTLVATQPVPFTVNSLSASFPSTTVPYWNLIQSFNWSASVTGTVASGNLTYTGGASGTLTSTGATAGSSNSLNSTLSYTLSTSDYTGAGLYGYGTRTIPATVTRSVTPATIYYPIFWKITSNNNNPNFTTSDSSNTTNYALGQGASTNTTVSDYLWIAIKASTGSHTFAFTFLSAQATVVPDKTYTNQTIGGEVYNVYGFTNANQVTFIYTIT